MKRESKAPLSVAIFLLLLPLVLLVLYVASYLALVEPYARPTALSRAFGDDLYWEHYRMDCQSYARLFWPLEQIDRKLRPGAWHELIHFDDGPRWLEYPDHHQGDVSN